MKKQLVAALLASLVSVAATAQTTAAAPAAAFVSLTKDAPYSAEEVVVYTRRTLDGSEQTSSTVNRVYRDSAGRQRTDYANEAGKIERISLRDIDGSYYTLNPAIGQAAKVSFPGGSTPPVAGTTRTTTTTTTELGTRDFDGIAATGTQTVIETAADGINQRPASTWRREAWTARDMALVLASKSSDAMMERSTTLRNLKREEPPAEMLATLLSHYTLVDKLPIVVNRSISIFDRH